MKCIINFMTKKEIRNIYKQKRLLLKDNEQTQLNDLLLVQFQQLALPDAHIILSYHPIQQLKEIDLSFIESFISFRNPAVQFAYPKLTDDEGNMEVVIESADVQYQLNKWHMLEAKNIPTIDPSKIDIVFLPLLAMDKRGYRVGYGKGYYDRFLTRCKKNVCYIGFSYFEPIDEITDTQTFDVPLHIGITPYHIYEF